MRNDVVTFPCAAATTEDEAWEINARVDVLLAAGISPADIYIGGTPLDDTTHLAAA